jgi:ABC-type Mn2+/Zn2+ transport system permease subunit
LYAAGFALSMTLLAAEGLDLHHLGWQRMTALYLALLRACIFSIVCNGVNRSQTVNADTSIGFIYPSSFSGCSGPAKASPCDVW